jgi:hypothetical protein
MGGIVAFGAASRGVLCGGCAVVHSCTVLTCGVHALISDGCMTVRAATELHASCDSHDGKNSLLLV